MSKISGGNEGIFEGAFSEGNWSDIPRQIVIIFSINSKIHLMQSENFAAKRKTNKINEGLTE